ncbi:hypothetical protein [Streptomyces panaciradicis]|uniref:hypothetical protein n=1 Tax=Streptomyces panaciradicis TaxID=1470261 RepID=UPI00201D061B|nr:hypothetical protein [Streptomyces panaciradicis]MCL6667868.1 hypothetical protein [Streptomyces panaciradicis]
MPYVKGARVGVWARSTVLGSGRRRGCLYPSDPLGDTRTSLQEFTMADLAFVVTMIVCFALVALVAKGVTKL